MSEYRLLVGMAAQRYVRDKACEVGPDGSGISYFGQLMFSTCDEKIQLTLTACILVPSLYIPSPRLRTSTTVTSTFRSSDPGPAQSISSSSSMTEMMPRNGGICVDGTGSRPGRVRACIVPSVQSQLRTDNPQR